MKTKLSGSSGMGVGADLVMNAGIRPGAIASHHYLVECFDRDGKLKWVEEFDNITVNEGLDEILDKFWKGSTYTATHYVGLKLTGAIVAGDTMASHAGWSESTVYSNANRPTFTPGTVSGQSVDNSASKAVFNINGSATITGGFVTTNNTKGGSTGILIGGGEFAASRGVANGDTLNVTVTATQVSA